MKILSCKPQHGAYLELTLEDGQVHRVHREIAAQYGLSQAEEIPEDTLRQLLFDNDLRRAFQRALYLLDGQDYSFQMLFKKLEKSYHEDVCYEVMSRLVKQGFINDWKYAQQIAAKAFEGKRYGPRRIRQILYEKGIPETVISKVLRPYAEDLETQIEHLLQLLERKYSRFLERPEDQQSIAKVKRALLRMGYGYGPIQTALQEYFEETLSGYDSEYEDESADEDLL
ncbi:MAG: regulatory protein RecX [Ruminococcus sp.]|nr:regulatory protein RecX [Ruminococcus sp.]